MRAMGLCVLALVGCYSPAYQDCVITCNSGSCPSGYECLANVCRAPGANLAQSCDEILGDANLGMDAGRDAPPPPDDRDADGVADVQDNCLTVANTEQYNEDGDMSGDACDLCPIVSSVSVAGADDDSDGDGVGNACDPIPNMNTERLLLFDGLNALPAGTTPTGNVPFTFSQGKASANAASGPTLFANLPFTLSTFNAARMLIVRTNVTLTSFDTTNTNNNVKGAGPASSLGTDGSGFACDFGANNGMAGLYNANLSPGNDAPAGGGFPIVGATNGSMKAIRLRRDSGQFDCSDTATTTAAPAATTSFLPTAGLHVRGVAAAFDFILVVDTPSTVP